MARSHSPILATWGVCDKCHNFQCLHRLWSLCYGMTGVNVSSYTSSFSAFTGFGLSATRTHALSRLSVLYQVSVPSQALVSLLRSPKANRRKSPRVVSVPSQALVSLLPPLRWGDMHPVARRVSVPSQALVSLLPSRMRMGRQRRTRKVVSVPSQALVSLLHCNPLGAALIAWLSFSAFTGFGLSATTGYIPRAYPRSLKFQCLHRLWSLCY